MQYRLNKEQIQQVCKRYEGGENSIVLSKKFNISDVAIRGLLKRRNIARRPQYIAQRKCCFDETVFDILTPESMYWMGFIFADGTIVERKGTNPCLALVLSSKDSKHIEKFKKFFKSSHKIIDIKCNYKHCTAKRFSINSKHITDKLKYYGWNKKLQTKTRPELVFSSHFWRGVIDGDGWIGVTRNKYKYPRLDLVGGYPLLSQFVKYIYSIVPDWKGHIRPHKSIFVVGLGGIPATKIIHSLYHDAPISLERKFNAAQNILQFGKLNIVGQELPKLKRSGRGGVSMPLVELRSPIQSLIG